MTSVSVTRESFSLELSLVEPCWTLGSKVSVMSEYE